MASSRGEASVWVPLVRTDPIRLWPKWKGGCRARAWSILSHPRRPRPPRRESEAERNRARRERELGQRARRCERVRALVLPSPHAKEARASRVRGDEIRSACCGVGKVPFSSGDHVGPEENRGAPRERERVQGIA